MKINTFSHSRVEEYFSFYPVSSLLNFFRHSRMDCAINRNIQIYLQTILDHNFGLNKRKARVVDVFGGIGGGGWQNADNNNSVSLELPYGGKTIKWDFTFHLENLREPPEVFADDGFFETVTLDELKHTVTCLRNWQPNSPDCLLNYALQLLDLYHIRQIEILDSSRELSRFKMEYEIIVKSLKTEAFKAAIHHSDRGTSMELTILLPIEVEGISLSQNSVSSPTLCLEYKTFAETYVKLDIGEELEQIIGKCHMPRLTEDITTVDYINIVQLHLQDKVEIVKKSLRARQRLLCEIQNLAGEKLLDIETELWSRISFFVEQGMQRTVCLVDLSARHPYEAPVLSVLLMNSSNPWNVNAPQRPTEQNLHEFPYHYNPECDCKLYAQNIVAAFNKHLGIDTENYGKD